MGGRNPVRIMGILNASPESFHKGSVRTSRADIRDAAKGMEDEGADFIDIGGMSTAPYLRTTVSERTEAGRILRALGAARDGTNLPVSVDTCRANVARAALEEGAEIINDVSGLKYDPGMPDAVSRHMPHLILCAYSPKRVAGSPASTARLLGESVGIARDAGIPRGRLAVDPAIGFFRRTGKGGLCTRIGTDWQVRDISMIRNLRSIRAGLPVLVSVSNKSLIGAILDRDDPSERVFGSVAAEAACVMNGADIIRTHNVRASADAAAVARALRPYKGL